MEYIIQILVAFIVINSILKISFWKLWQAALFGVLCAVFVVATCRFAILQSKTQLADFLRDVRVMQDAAVLLTIESILCIAFCFAMLRDGFDRGKRRKRLTALHCYPGLLLFPALFYVETQLVFAMPGVNFTSLSSALALALCIGIPSSACLAKRLYPERELRLEVHFLVGLFICITGLITTVNGNVTCTAMEAPLNVKALLSAVSLFVLAFFSGYFGNKLKWLVRQKKKKHQSIK
ncbi:MAG: hypothetical protein LBT83_02820 [Tannerella sp.]|jgi:hypothetical protein|nr:hypothetical protein [Tannerella sp.]